MTVDVTADGRFVVEGRLCAAPKVDFGNGCAVLVLGDVAELIVVSALSVRGSTASVFSTFTPYLTTAHAAPCTVLVTAAVGVTSWMVTLAVSQPLTGLPFESVPLTHALSVKL